MVPGTYCIDDETSQMEAVTPYIEASIAHTEDTTIMMEDATSHIVSVYHERRLQRCMQII